MVTEAHETLVKMILNWLDKRGFGGDAQVFTDAVGMLGSTKPKKINGYIPDVYCEVPGLGHTIIGDAKTPNDLETRHTRAQLEAYADYLATHRASGELVIATRFEWAGSARSILKNLGPVRQRGVPAVRVLCEFGEWS
jgi:hypothetical protein